MNEGTVYLEEITTPIVKVLRNREQKPHHINKCYALEKTQTPRIQILSERKRSIMIINNIGSRNRRIMMIRYGWLSF